MKEIFYQDEFEKLAKEHENFSFHIALSMRFQRTIGKALQASYIKLLKTSILPNILLQRIVNTIYVVHQS